MDLYSSNENNDNSTESWKFQEDFLDTPELSYSVDLNDLSESNQIENDESIPDLCLLKRYDFGPLVKNIPNNTDVQTTEGTTKRVGNTNWCQCGLCQPMENEAESLCYLDTNEVPDEFWRLLLALLLALLQYQIYYKELFIFREQMCYISEGLKTVCLPKNVLKTALSALNDLRYDNLTDTSNCAYRYAGYKQYTWWVHNNLGKGVRKVIPSCAVWTIRNNYPSKDGKYISFMESKEGEKRLIEENWIRFLSSIENGHNLEYFSEAAAWRCS